MCAMVSYYNTMAMYRQQTSVGATGPPGPQFHHHHSAPSWYSGYHPQSNHPVPGHHQQYCAMQEDHPTAAPTAWHHPVLHHHQEFPEFGPAAGDNHGQQILGHEATLPSPPITVSAGSEMSSPGGGGPHGDSVSPPTGVRVSAGSVMQGGRKSPYEWMRKPSYQSQPNPDLHAPQFTSTPSLLDFTSTDANGKTRTKDKYRVVYTDHQRLELEKEFHYSRYITIRRKAELAANLGLSERQVKIWFQNRRAKERKQVKKREELTQKDFKMEPGMQHHHDAMLTGGGGNASGYHQTAALSPLHQAVNMAAANMAAVAAANMHQQQLQMQQQSIHQLCTPD